MAVGDQAGPASKGGIPLWVILAGGAAVGLFLWSRNRSKAAATSTGAALVPGVATDPNTGLPIDPLTGLPYITTPTQAPTLQSWATGAEQWLAQHGVSPTLANRTVYDYINGQLMDANELGTLNKLLGGYGYPSTDILPTSGYVLPPPTPVAPHPQPPPAPHIVASNFPNFISALQHKLAPIPAGGGVNYGAPVYALVGQTPYGPLYEQGAAVNQARMFGGTLYTLPEFKGYITGGKAA